MVQISQSKIKVNKITQVAIAVKDFLMVAENYWNILGIRPWDIYEWTAPLVYDRKYHGKPTWGRERIVVTDVGGVQLELCQPVEGDSIYQDFLDEHGEGLHHVNFLVYNVDETAEILVKQGFSSLQSGRHGLPEYRGAFNYIDIKSLRTIWEPTHYRVVLEKKYQDKFPDEEDFLEKLYVQQKLDPMFHLRPILEIAGLYPRQAVGQSSPSTTGSLFDR